MSDDNIMFVAQSGRVYDLNGIRRYVLKELRQWAVALPWVPQTSDERSLAADAILKGHQMYRKRRLVNGQTPTSAARELVMHYLFTNADQLHSGTDHE